MNQNSPILTTLETQLSQRLEKLWRVFSWCSSILISITGAVLFANHASNIKLAWQECTIISVVVIILTLYAYLWINENLVFEGKIRNEIEKIFEQEYNYTQLKTLRPDNAKFGYKAVIFLLGLVALAATWLNAILP
jgi:cytochrome b subunit of formate dehydrogenase